MSTPIHAFAASSGTAAFDVVRGSSAFVVACVLFRADRLAAAEATLEAVRARHFGGGPFRSGAVGDDAARRLRILEDALAADFTLHAVAVDKRRLGEEGFQDPAAFDDYLNHLLYRDLFKAFPKLTLAVGEEAGEPFLQQFRRYVQAQHPPDLFGGFDFGFTGGGDSILTGFAGFLAGTLRRAFGAGPKDGEGARYLALLQPRITGLRQIPEGGHDGRRDAADDSSYNATVAALGVRTARQFIDSKIAVDEDDRDQVACARLLLLYFNTYGSGRYLTAMEILQHLNEHRSEELTLRRFQTKTIAPLRDAGVLVVSSASGEHKGYKLPSSLEDLHKYVSHSNSMIMPLLSRIRIFRDALRAASGDAIDILDRPEFEGLQKLLGR